MGRWRRGGGGGGGGGGGSRVGGLGRGFVGRLGLRIGLLFYC